jgi:hypothetical protein
MDAEAGRFFLATYRPLCRTPAGQKAARQFGLLPYVDGSCRREPDLESAYPSVSALCRARMFAPRLREGDRVAYITKLGCYSDYRPAHWRLTALLLIERRFESHADAADWYREQGLVVPRNCMVNSNPPLPLDHTDGHLSRDIKSRTRGMSADQIVRVWDQVYRERAKEHRMVLSCTALFRELADPPPIFEDDWVEWIGRRPATQTSPLISENLWLNLMSRARSLSYKRDS